MRYMLLFFIPTLAFAFDCRDQRDLKTEKDEKVTFCNFKELQLSQKCASQGDQCQILKDLKKRPDAKKLKEALTHSAIGTTGSRLCNLKGWTVLMSEMFDKSQVCTCKHPTGEFITCVSLDNYYRN